MASMNYFDSKRKNLTYFLETEWKFVIEMHVITKSTNFMFTVVFSI